MFKHKGINKESGNSLFIALGVVALIAVGALIYFVQAGSDKPAAAIETATATETPAAGDTAVDKTKDPAASAKGTEDKAIQESAVKAGNPVVAKVDGTDITRNDVFNYIQTLPPNARQVPVQQLFPMAQEQVVSAAIINEKTKGANLENDPEVQKQLALAKENIVRSVYIQQMVEKKVTEDLVKKAYEDYKAAFPAVDEVNARHILVKDEVTAKDLIKQLDGGADFAELAKKNSTDGTAEGGGEVGWFAKADVVPDFANAAFALEPGTYTKEPVKTEFGWHVIKVEEKRKRPVPEYDQAKPFLEAQVRRSVLEEMINEWRKEASVEKFDINGNKIEPAAGGE